MSTIAFRRAANEAPEPVARIADIMSAFPRTWFLCGGWAVDAWLGRQSRDHIDLDIVIFEEDQRAIFEHLAGWHLIADIGEAGDARIDPWDGRPVPVPSHVHATRDDSGLNLEVLFNERTRREWVLRREPRVSLPLRRCSRRSGWGIPTAVPEVLLLYKATAYAGTKHYMRPHDRQDFLALLPRLAEGQRVWLRRAICLVNPDHPWLAELSP